MGVQELWLFRRLFAQLQGKAGWNHRRAGGRQKRDPLKCGRATLARLASRIIGGCQREKITWLAMAAQFNHPFRITNRKTGSLQLWRLDNEKSVGRIIQFKARGFLVTSDVFKQGNAFGGQFQGALLLIENLLLQTDSDES